MAVNKIKKGSILIAQPHSSCNAIFDKSIVLIADHNVKGSVGFILNKSLNYSIKDLLPEIASDFKINQGGPIEPESLYFIHNVPNLIENSVQISKNVYWGGNFNEVKNLLNNNSLKKEDILFFLGYSGWGVNQLEDEIEEEHWIIDNKNNSIFNLMPIDWNNKIVEHNPDIAFWINAPNNPNYN